ncbi:class II fructose-bisphosphate aldolase, partial [Escherichia coli]|nr:class II fructose-bisphosphate aldolase [Escherichia coli]
HGLDDIPRIDITLLKRIAEVYPVPLVIHGGCGSDPEILRSFVNYRVDKGNIASDLRKAFRTAVGKAYVKNHNEANLARVMASAKNDVEEDVYSKSLMMN